MQFLEDLVGPPAYSSSSPQLISDQWMDHSMDGLLFCMILKGHLLKFDIFIAFFLEV